MRSIITNEIELRKSFDGPLAHFYKWSHVRYMSLFTNHAPVHFGGTADWDTIADPLNYSKCNLQAPV